MATSTPDLQRRLDYLTDAAHLLATTAPETSAYVMAQRDGLVRLNDVKKPRLQDGHACGSCGHIFLAQQGSTVDVGSIATDEALEGTNGTKRTKGAKPRRGRADRGVTSTCGRCGRYTTITFPPPARSKKSITGARCGAAAALDRPTATTASGSATPLPSTRGPTPISTSTAPTSKPGSSVNKRKRAKNKKGGLQALLEQNKPSAPPTGFGLSLSDFLK